MPKRQSNRPDRRIAASVSMSEAELQALADRLRYTGSSHHKQRPADYGFVPPVNPRPSKSLCDDRRPVLRDEAIELLRQGVFRGMFSHFERESVPKYIWAVDNDGEVYEAKCDVRAGIWEYHGYRLGDNEKTMRRYILTEWRHRCQES